MQNLSKFWFPHNGQFRVRESSDREVAGQLLVTVFHSFESVSDEIKNGRNWQSFGLTSPFN